MTLPTGAGSGPEATLRTESFLILSRLQSGTEEVVRLDAALAAVAGERERIRAAVTRCTLFAETCDNDGPEVDTARKALACTILAAIAGYEAPPPGSLFGA